MTTKEMVEVIAEEIDDLLSDLAPNDSDIGLTAMKMLGLMDRVKIEYDVDMPCRELVSDAVNSCKLGDHSWYELLGFVEGLRAALQMLAPKKEAGEEDEEPAC